MKKLFAILSPVLISSTALMALAQQLPPLPPEPVAVASVCDTLTSRTEVFNGKSYTKYNIVDSSFIKCPQVRATIPKMLWKVKKTAWSAQDEQDYANFIKNLGYSKCNTTDKCLAGADNTLRSEEDMLFTHYSDCADFPYYLRSYFSYKKNLPFAMVTDMQQAPFTDKQQLETDTERARLLAEQGQEALDKYNARVADERYSRRKGRRESRFRRARYQHRRIAGRRAVQRCFYRQCQ